MKILVYVICLCWVFALQGCAKSLTEIIKNTEDASFTIYTYDEYGAPKGSGSGFFIESTGIGLTNYHVLDGAIKAVIKTSEGKEYEIEEVLASRADWDIAKFKISNLGDITFPILEMAKTIPEKGEKVYNMSAPLGLENSVSEGIVSSYREDELHGNIIQVTAPISPGSSGSAILNQKGQYFAMATFQKSKGQNLNFGVVIDNAKLNMLRGNDFASNNPSFNRGENFILLNIPSDKGSEIILHAIEFKKNVTIAYFSYTNLFMVSEEYRVWCELNKKNDGFLIHDKDRDIKYYITSSTLGTTKSMGTVVPLASNTKFRVYFPPIKDKLNNIDIVCGYDSRGWQFTNIKLNEYRNRMGIDAVNYLRDYAYSMMNEGDFVYSVSILKDILENSPEDELALNALGIISFVCKNYSDAQFYFSKAIDANPNSTLGYLNRSQLFRAHGDYKNALNDVDKVIAIDPVQPDNYIQRAYIYADIGDWNMAISNLDEAIKSEDFKYDPDIYVYRAVFYANMNNFARARKDIKIAYNLTNDAELEKELQIMWKKLGGD